MPDNNTNQSTTNNTQNLNQPQSGDAQQVNQEVKDFNLQEFPILTDENGRYTNEPILLGIANHLHISSGAGTFGDGTFDFGEFKLPQNIMDYINQAIANGEAPNSAKWEVGSKRNLVQTFLTTMTGAGISSVAAVCLGGAAATEMGFKEGPYHPEPTEFANRGWSYAGEGIFGFTSWSTKLKVIQKSGVNLPTSESGYIAGPHMSDLGWPDQCKMGAAYATMSKYNSYFSNASAPHGDVLCAAFLFKAGDGFGGSTLWEKTLAAVDAYKRTHARMGYKVRNGFVEMAVIAMKIGKEFSNGSA